MPRKLPRLPFLVLLAGLAGLAALPAQAADEAAPEFTIDWFTHTIPLWEQSLAGFRGRSGLRYLEIGVYEGRSLLWMLDNVLTAEDARATGIDPFLEPGTEERFRANLAKSGHGEKVELIVGYSQIEMKRLEPDSYDVIYVDGSHTADDVLADAVLSWQLLRVGGLVIFDDYRWSGTGGPGRRPLPAELRPQVAVDAFVTAYRNEVEIVHRGYQMILRKQNSRCPSKWDCSPIGPYLYLWATASSSATASR